MDLPSANKEELVRDLKAGESLDCSSHEMVRFRILRGGNKAKSRTTALGFRRAAFGLFRNVYKRG